MANFLASAARAVSNNFGAYILLLQKEEHMQRQANLDAKRETNAQNRWNAQQTQSKQQHSDNMSLQKDRLSANTENQSANRASTAEQKILSKYQGFQQSSMQATDKIRAQKDKAVDLAVSQGESKEAIEAIKVRFNQDLASSRDRYDEAAQPFKNKLIESGWLPEELKEETTEEVDQEKTAVPGSTVKSQKADTASAPGRKAASGTGNELLMKGKPEIREEQTQIKSYDPNDKNINAFQSIGRYMTNPINPIDQTQRALMNRGSNGLF